MAKRKRKRARRKRSNPTKKRVHRRRRRRVANPAPRRRRRRAHRRNPSRRRRSHRRTRRNPSRRSGTRSRRAHRRNPGGPIGAVAIALGLAVAAFAVVQAGGYFTSKDGVTNAQRNRGIIAAVVSAGALAMAKKHPGPAAGVVLGSLLGAFGGWLTIKIFGLLPAKHPATTGAVYADNMAGYNQMGGYQPAQMGAYQPAQMGAVYADNMRGMGDLAPPAPWQVATPYDGGSY